VVNDENGAGKEGMVKKMAGQDGSMRFIRKIATSGTHPVSFHYLASGNSGAYSVLNTRMLQNL